MANQSVALFLQACGAAGPLRVGVEHPSGQETLRREFEQPLLLVGREAGVDLPLGHPAVSRRHAYLQVIAGHVFCLDLHSRTGVLWDGQPRCCGWLEPDRAVGIGPFAVRLLGVGDAGGPPADAWDPLAVLPADQDPLPPVSLEILSSNRKTARWRMDRTLAVVGQGPGGVVRVGGRSVLRPYCALLRTPLGLWVIDLLAPGGVSVNGTPHLRWARLEAGDELLVGELSLRVAAHAEPAPTPAPPPVAEKAADALAPGEPPAGEAERAERERLRAGQQAAAAEAEQVRARLIALEQSLAEASAARDELVKAGQEAGARWEAERLTLREQWEQALAEERERFDAACRQFDCERGELRREMERLHQEAEILRRDGERLAAELARAEVEAGQFRALRAELESRQGQDASLRASLEAARAEAAEARRQWQEQLDAVRRQFDQERSNLRGEVERLRQEAASLGQQREAPPRRAGTMSVITVTAAAPAPTAAARQEEPTGLDAVFIALGKGASARPGGAGPAGGRGKPPAKP